MNKVSIFFLFLRSAALPVSPASFRLFGLCGVFKREEEMGQTQSYENSPSTEQPATAASTSSPDSDAVAASSSPMESLIAEAVAFGGEDENESLEAKAQKALECPCIADLRSGPCGSQFSEAFLCFLKSTAEEKGSDCVHPFVALQNCIKANPGAFSKDVLEDGEEEEEEQTKKTEEQPVQDYRIIPPIWAKEPRSGKSKL